MKFPVAPESMSVVVSMVLFFPGSKMGKLMVLLLGDATSTQLIEWEEDIEVTSLLKIQGSWSGNLSDLLRGFFIAGGKHFKNV